MADAKNIPGKFVWFEYLSSEPRKAQAFFGEVFGWRTVPYPMGAFTYEMIYAGDTMIGGYAQPRAGARGARWLSAVSVEDVDAAAREVEASGGRLLERPMDIPGTGRRAILADPEGTELALYRNVRGDPPDLEFAPEGTFFWNELHTSDPAAALTFYGKVVGFTHASHPGGNDYHVLSKGGVGRAGVTRIPRPGEGPYWQPYVMAKDVDRAMDRARRLDAAILVKVDDIPGVGRAGVFRDPLGGTLAIMNPLPRDKMR